MKAIYNTFWDTGSIISTPCEYDAEKNLCFNIQSVSIDLGSALLIRESIELPNGKVLREIDHVAFEF